MKNEVKWEEILYFNITYFIANSPPINFDFDILIQIWNNDIVQEKRITKIIIMDIKIWEISKIWLQVSSFRIEVHWRKMTIFFVFLVPHSQQQKYIYTCETKRLGYHVETTSHVCKIIYNSNKNCWIRDKIDMFENSLEILNNAIKNWNQSVFSDRIYILYIGKLKTELMNTIILQR